MSMEHALQLYRLYWMFRSHREQRLAWQDASEARQARTRAEARAAAQLDAMLDANPSGQLGNTELDDEKALRRAGLL